MFIQIIVVPLSYRNNNKSLYIMTQNEFFSRTNIELLPCEFEKVHEAYMLTEMDKDAFCKMFLKLSEYERNCMIMAGINKARMEKEIRQWEKDFHEAVKNAELEKIEIAKFLADEAHEYSSIKARAKAIEIMGFKMYIAYKISKGYGMWEIDNQEIIEHLTD